MLNRYHLSKIAAALALCLCVSIAGVYAAPVGNTGPVLAEFEVTVGENGITNVENLTSDAVTRDFGLALIKYTEVGSNLYRFEIELNGGSYFTIGSASVTLDYGDGSSALFTHGSNREALATLTTTAYKSYSPGTYTLHITSGFVNTYDHFGNLDRIEGSDLVNKYSPWLTLTVQ